MSETEIRIYLKMQFRQYERRAATAIIERNKVINDSVVGNYHENERYPFDENILKNFKGPYDSVLEYGCGPGRNLRRLALKFKHVAGVDISKINCENARKFLALNDFQDYEIFLTPGDSIPTQKQYDLVFEVICLQHICSYTIRTRILAEMVRVCKSGGLIVCQFGFNDKTLPRSNHNTRYYADYYENDFKAEDTNGWADCCVTDEFQLINDLQKLGLKEINTWHTPSAGPDINHDKWIWISGKKP